MRDKIYFVDIFITYPQQSPGASSSSPRDFEALIERSIAAIITMINRRCSTTATLRLAGSVLDIVDDDDDIVASLDIRAAITRQ